MAYVKLKLVAQLLRCGVVYECVLWKEYSIHILDLCFSSSVREQVHTNTELQTKLCVEIYVFIAVGSI